MKEELIKIFLELLEEWENAEEVVINDRGSSDEYEELEQRKEDYVERFNRALNNSQ